MTDNAPSDAMTDNNADRRMLEALVCPVTQGLLNYDAERQELVSRKAGLAFPDPRWHPDHAGIRGAQLD